MKASEIKTGTVYGHTSHLSESTPAFQRFDHAEVLAANVRTIAQLEAAGYTMRRYFGSHPSDAQEQQAKLDYEAAIEAGKIDLGEKYIELDREGKFPAMQLVRITANSRVSGDRRYDEERGLLAQLTTKEVEPSVKLVKARNLVGEAADLIERAERYVATTRERQQQNLARTGSKTAQLGEINDLLAGWGIDAKADASAESDSEPQVKLTLAELHRLTNQA